MQGEEKKVNGPEVMFPLHPPSGGPARGYVCNADGICKDVTRTKRGMWTHLRVVHGIVKQAKLDFERKESAA